jgi:thioredoxin:protein disulfide reductase
MRMRRRFFLPLAIVLLASAGPLHARQGPAPITLTPIAEAASGQPGTTVRLALEVSTPRGLHLQSDRPRDPALIPTRLAIDAPAGFVFVDVVFPKSTDFRVIGFDQPLAVFEGNFTVGARVSIPKNQLPGPVTLPARFRYQACDETACYGPKTVSTSWTIQVGPGNAQPSAEHVELFRGIEWARAEPPPALPIPARPTPSIAKVDSEDVLSQLDRFEVLGSTGGYLGAADFVEFVGNAEAGVRPSGLLDGRGPLAILALVFIGGLALNLTPCVLPMIPINLAIIGAGARSTGRSRGFFLGSAYGAAMAVVYGVLGLAVILTASTFGTINSSPWFNFGIAVLFVFLGLAMFDVGSLDFSRFSSRIRFDDKSRGTFLLAFGMGGVAALLAGACVAPVVVQVVVFASNLYASGTPVALALPFVLGLGMALPWPIAGAGLAALPKPGAWMVRVKQAMGIFILATAAYYAYVGYGILANRWVDPAVVRAGVEEQIKAGWHASLSEGLKVAERDRTPVLIDFWATWCKNCLVMDQTTLKDPAVTARLASYTRIKFQAEDMDATPAKEILKRVGGVGLPTYAVLRPK